MSLRFHVISAVFWRNFLSYFSGVIGYLFIVVFVGLGALAAFQEQFFADNLANLDQLNAWFPWLLLFIIPAVTMSAWSEERKQGTDELLFTLPATDLEILLGKYLAVLGIYTTALAFSFSHVIVLALLGRPDLGLLIANYFGYWITGASLITAGLVGSILTNSPTVAFVLGAILCAIPAVTDRVPLINEYLPSLTRVLERFCVTEQFRDFTMGMIPLSGVLYFASIGIFALYINLVLISRRHWSGGPHGTDMGIQYLVRTVSLALVLIGINAIFARVAYRLDLTGERLYTLSPTTLELLRNIKSEQPVTITAYISPQVPRDLVPVRSSLLGLLRQYDQVGGNNLQVNIVNTEKYSEEAELAKNVGINPQEMQSERGGRVENMDVYLGVRITSSIDDEVVVPFFDKGTPVEYELTRSIRTISQAKRSKVAILRTDAKVNGGFDMQSFRSSPEWRIISELKKQYEVKDIGPEELATAKYDVLIAVMPSSLTDAEMKHLVDYVEAGHPTLIMDDAFSIFNPGISPKMPKPRQGGMFGGGPPPTPKADNGELTTLCNALEIAWTAGDSVWQDHDPHPELSAAFERYNVVYIAPGSGATPAFSSQSAITSDLQEVMLFYPGSIKQRDKSNLTFTALMRTNGKSRVASWDEYAASSPFGGVQLRPVPEFKYENKPGAETIAAKISGENRKGNKINVVFIADVDMVANEFFFVRDKEWQGLRLDNITLILNAVDDLARDEAYMALRKRRPKHRTLSRIEQVTTKYKESELNESKEAATEAKKKLEEAKKRFSDDIAKIEADQSLDERTKAIRIAASRENERRRIEVETANINNERDKKLKAIKARTERQTRQTESVFRIMSFLVPPIPVIVLGLLIFATRLREEREGIAAERLVR